MNEINQLKTQDIEKLLDLSEERLFMGLGQLLIAEEVIDGEPDATDQAIENLYGLQPESILNLMNRAKQYLTDQHDTIYQIICFEWNYCERIEDPSFSDNVTLVTVIVDLLTIHLLKAPITVTTVAVILVKKGLNSFCDCAKEAVSRSVSG